MDKLTTSLFEIFAQCISNPERYIQCSKDMNITRKWKNLDFSLAYPTDISVGQPGLGNVILHEGV